MSKLESIITKYNNYSVFSGHPKECDHHLIFGVGRRKLASEDRLTIPLLNCEHNSSSKGTIYQIHGNPAAEKLSKMLGQVAFEKGYLADRLAECEELGHQSAEDWMDEAREAFRKRYGESYL